MPTTKTPTAAKAADLVKKYEAELASAQSNTKAAEAELGTARIAADVGGAGNSLVDRARKHLATCRAAEVEAEATLNAAQRQYAEAVVVEAEATLGTRWDEVGKLQQQREVEAAEAERLSESLIVSLNKIIDLSAAIHRTVPAKPAGGTMQSLIETALLGHGSLLAAWRIHTGQRAQWKWLAPEITWQAFPSFAERIRGAGAYLARLRGPSAPAETGGV